MKKLMLAAVLALPFMLLSAPKASAGDCCTPTYRVGFCLGLTFKGFAGTVADPCGGKSCGKSCCGGSPVGCGYGPVSAAPWYSYFPYGAHFQTPAPTGYPSWPGPQTAGPTPLYGYNYSAPQAPAMGYPASAVQPVGYNQQVPSYWYGR